MGDVEAIQHSKSKQITQPPSVPFLWEERPGVAKKDWKPVVSSVTTILAPPVKLIASVPFDWEEKPGKPLSCFSQPQPEPALETSPFNLLALPWHQASSPCNESQNHEDEDNGEDDFSDERREFESDIESFGSLSSAPFLPANCLVSSVAIATAVPVQKATSMDDIDGQLEIPSSPTSETDSSTSSYATGISSLEGAAFLERLFPLYSPRSGFLGKASQPTKEPPNPETNRRDFDYGCKSTVMVQRPRTLGELIMMSRRRSCQRKALQMRMRNPSVEFMNKDAIGCCIFGASIRMIEGLQRKMRQPRLKLM